MSDLKLSPKRPCNLPLQVKVEGQHLVIRIGLGTLQFVAEHCPRFYDAYKGNDDGPYVKVVNRHELARDIVRALEHEQEDGTTPLHILLDDAIEYAYDDGSLAFDYEAQHTKVPSHE